MGRKLEQQKWITFPHVAGKMSQENLTERSPGGFLSPFFHAWHPDNQNLPLPFNLHIKTIESNRYFKNSYYLAWLGGS